MRIAQEGQAAPEESGQGVEADPAPPDEQEQAAPEESTQAVEPDPVLPEELEPRAEGTPIWGRLSSRYRARAADGDQDHDLTSTLWIDVGDPTRQRWTAHVLGWLSWDIDGGTSDPFADVSDSFDGQVTTRLYSAYAEYHGFEELELLRLGRQELSATPVFLTFDGARARLAPRGERALSLEAYAGIPAHFYESSAEGDLVAGVAAEARPWEAGRVRLDYMHLEDESLLGDLANDLVALGVWQGLGRNTTLDGRVSLLEGDGRDLFLRGTWFDPERALTVQSSYKLLFETQERLVQELDPFTATLLTLEPFHRFTLLVIQELRERVALEAGYSVRQLLDSDDEGEFNREYGRLHASATWLGLFDGQGDLTVFGEHWNATGSDSNTWGLDLSREWERLEASVGSYFAAYKFDALLVTEREDVRTYYADLEWLHSDATSLDLRYEFENGPLDDYHLLRLGLTWSF